MKLRDRLLDLRDGLLDIAEAVRDGLPARDDHDDDRSTEMAPEDQLQRIRVTFPMLPGDWTPEVAPVREPSAAQIDVVRR